MKTKLKLLIVLLLVSTLSGWTQQFQKPWVITVDKNKDTTIVYTFKKNELKYFHLRYVELEQKESLYSIEKLISENRLEIIKNQKEQISLKDTTITNANSKLVILNTLYEKSYADYQKQVVINANAKKKGIIGIITTIAVTTIILKLFFK